MPPDKYKQLAKKYYVDDITSALIPGGRLSNILKQLKDGKLLSDYTIQYLRSKGLLALSQYAQKKILLAEFLKSAKVEQAKRRLKTQAKTKEKTAKKLQEQDRLVKRKAAQEQAAAKKRAFDNNPKNIARKKQEYKQLAKKYYVDDITSALIPGGRLFNILKQLKDSRLFPDYTIQYLRSKGLLALSQYAQKKILLAEFLKSAKVEQAQRRLETKSKTVTRKKQDKLRQKYDLSFFIQRADFLNLMKILHKVDNGIRLSEDEIIWLLTKEDGEYYTVELREGYHKNEAEFYVSEFKKRKNPWAAVNASSHYRKCNEAEAADLLLQTINIDKFKNVRLKSALCTTHGGAKRDLKQWKKALALGKQAHLLTPQDFRPCTLLGALNIEIGRYDLGFYWYNKAIARGYSERAMDDDLRSIFMRAKKKKKEELKNYLLNIDSFRYRWVNKYKN